MTNDTHHQQFDLSLFPEPPASLHMVGIGGIGMSGLARMLAKQKYQITGSDAADSPVVDGLRAEGFAVTVGHAAENLGKADLVITTAAAPDANPELVAARERGIPVVKRAAVLGLLSDRYDCIAVAGTHGKSTTSGMLSLALVRAGESPSFAVGAMVNGLDTNAQAGEGRLFVAEADEYDYSFLWLKPRVAIVTNIEYDHPDLFPTLDSIEEAFDQFVSSIQPGGTLVTCLDDPGCRHLISRVRDLPVRIVTYGFDAEADWRAERVVGRDVVTAPDGRTLRLRLQVPGRHNRLNALAVFAAADAVGVDPFGLIAGLEEFAGVGRRFEVRGQEADVTVIDDYAHHPTEIRATIVAGRERYPAAQLIVVFQPHTYSRTKHLLAEFSAALDLADRVVLCPIYPSRETDDLGIRSEDIAAGMVHSQVNVARDFQEAGALATEAASPGDVVLVLGAGDVWRVSDETLKLLRDRSGQR